LGAAGCRLARTENPRVGGSIPPLATDPITQGNGRCVAAHDGEAVKQLMPRAWSAAGRLLPLRKRVIETTRKTHVEATAHSPSCADCGVNTDFFGRPRDLGLATVASRRPSLRASSRRICSAGSQSQRSRRARVGLSGRGEPLFRPLMLNAISNAPRYQPPGSTLVVKMSWSFATAALGAVAVQTWGGTSGRPVPGHRNSSALRVSIQIGCRSSMAESPA
jgi:hypothetical protein